MSAQERPVERGRMLVYGSAEELARATAQRFVEVARQCVAERGRFVVALAGGTTPRRMYEVLGSLPPAQAPPWADTHVFFGDERHVAPTDPSSNYRMAAEAMLTAAALPPGHLHRIESERDPEEAADAYEAAITAVFGTDDEVPRFDLVLLGLGPDGHTASIFRGTEASFPPRRLVAAPWVVKLAGRRITMTPRLLNAARRVWFLVTGATKASVLAHAVAEPETIALPVHHIGPPRGELLWLVDAAAAD